MFKTGVSSYCYSRLYKKGEFDIFNAIKCAKATGFDVIEFSGIGTPEGEEPLEFAEKVKKACNDTGIEVGNYTIGADLLNGSGGDLDKEIARLKKEVDVASVLGSKGMRHDAAWGFTDGRKTSRGFEDALPRLVKGCKEVTEYAASKGIVTMIENHGYFVQDSERVEYLINSVANPNFGVLLDIGNFLCVDEEPQYAVGRLAPYALHVHVKDFHFKNGNEPSPGKGWFGTRGGNLLRGAITGHGCVPVLACLRIIKNSGYKGTISIEFEGIEEPLSAIEMCFENLKNYIGML